MENLSQLKKNYEGATWKSEQKCITLGESVQLLAEDKQVVMSGRSPTSLTILRLLMESKNGEMLSRLQIKLGKTEKEIRLIIYEL